MSPMEYEQLNELGFFIAVQLNKKGKRPFTEIPLTEVIEASKQPEWRNKFSKRLRLDNRYCSGKVNK